MGVSELPFYRPPSRRVQRFALRAAVSLRYRRKTDTREEISIEVRIGERLASVRGWTNGARVDLLWGHGSDFGKICLVASPTGVLMKARGQTSKSLTVGVRSVPTQDIADEHGGVWRLLIKPQPMTVVRHFELPEGRLGLELPRSWFENLQPAKKFVVV